MSRTKEELRAYWKEQKRRWRQKNPEKNREISARAEKKYCQKKRAQGYKKKRVFVEGQGYKHRWVK